VVDHNNNNKNNKVVIMNNAPDLNKAPVVTNVSRTQKVNMVSTRSNISLAHETSAVSKSLISKYDATEKHVSTGIPIKVLKSCESAQTGSKLLITHENLTHFHMPQVIKNTDCDKPRIDRVTTSMGTDKGIIKVKYATTTTTKHDTTSTRPNISVAHEEASTATSKEFKSSELSSARWNFLNAHESKYTGMNTKYAITATEQSSYVPNPISNDNPINNNKSFCSQYLQTVLKITGNKNNNKHDTFNVI
jgi:hypothetical protein